MNTAEQMVPADQVDALRAAITSFMTASHLAMVDQKAAAAEFIADAGDDGGAARAVAHADDLREHAERQGARARRSCRTSAAFTEDPALSPARSTTVTAPVFLLHGADDNVVPAIESRRLAAVLERTAPVHLLVTSLITHAEVDRPPTAGEVWELIRFWRAVGAAGAL